MVKVGSDGKPLWWNTFHDHCRAQGVQYRVVSFDTGTNTAPAWVSSIEGTYGLENCTYITISDTLLVSEKRFLGEPRTSKVESKASVAEIAMRGLGWI